MSNNQNMSLLQQMLESAEKSLAGARRLLAEMSGTPAAPPMRVKEAPRPTDQVEGRVVEGVFDGQNMIGPDGKMYSVPANYASKSKLVEGDALKLTIAEDGSFIYKQIGPVERRRLIGTLERDATSDEFHVVVEGKPYKVLRASITYFKGDMDDQVVLLVPKNAESAWGAVENIIKSGDPAIESIETGDVPVEQAEAPSSEEPAS